MVRLGRRLPCPARRRWIRRRAADGDAAPCPPHRSGAARQVGRVRPHPGRPVLRGTSCPVPRRRSSTRGSRLRAQLGRSAGSPSTTSGRSTSTPPCTSVARRASPTGPAPSCSMPVYPRNGSGSNASGRPVDPPRTWRMTVSSEVRLVTTTARPTAVVAATTTWQEFPSLWGRLLDQVYECLATIDPATGCTTSCSTRTTSPRSRSASRCTCRSLPRAMSSRQRCPRALPRWRSTAARTTGSGRPTTPIWEWCKKNQRRPAGPRWEIYGDWHEDPSQLVTEVYYLLSPG